MQISLHPERRILNQGAKEHHEKIGERPVLFSKHLGASMHTAVADGTAETPKQNLAGVLCPEGRPLHRHELVRKKVLAGSMGGVLVVIGCCVLRQVCNDPAAKNTEALSRPKQKAPFPVPKSMKLGTGKGAF